MAAMIAAAWRLAHALLPGGLLLHLISGSMQLSKLHHTLGKAWLDGVRHASSSASVSPDQR